MRKSNPRGRLKNTGRSVRTVIPATKDARKKKPAKVPVPCLGPQCRGEKMFQSWDPKRNRLCERCRGSVETVLSSHEYTNELF